MNVSFSLFRLLFWTKTKVGRNCGSRKPWIVKRRKATNSTSKLYLVLDPIPKGKQTPHKKSQLQTFSLGFEWTPHSKLFVSISKNLNFRVKNDLRNKRKFYFCSEFDIKARLQILDQKPGKQHMQIHFLLGMERMKAKSHFILQPFFKTSNSGM